MTRHMPSTRRRERARRRRRDAHNHARRRYELNGRLMYPMSVAASPSVAPQILIENASYGWTEELLDAWKARYHKDIFDMLVSASRYGAFTRCDSCPSPSRCSTQASDPSQKDCWISVDARR